MLETTTLRGGEYAYHCTNVNPDIIKLRGFINGGGGFTCKNQFPELYERYLPKSQCFVSQGTYDDDAKYVIKIDISGMEKFPDFGHLLDYGAYFDEEGDDTVFWWKDGDVPRNGEWSLLPKPLVDYLDKHDDTIFASEFDGELCWKLIGTCCIDGSRLTPDRFVEVAVNESSGEHKDWRAITLHNRRVAAEKAAMLVPAELAASLVEKRDGGEMLELGGVARDKLVAAAGRPFSSIVHKDDGKVFVDIEMETAAGWDGSALERLLKYVGKSAPWLHLERKIVDQDTSFARLSTTDDLVLNAYRRLVGLDDERTDFEQMDFGF